jgi:hypothetical protein
VSASASIAISNLGQPNGPIDSVTAGYLTFMGDHLFKQELDAAKLRKKQPPFLSTVPAYFTRALRTAYGEIYLLDEHALTLSYINGTSPFAYPDATKVDKALLLLPSPDLIERELDRTSSLLAFRQGRALGLV